MIWKGDKLFTKDIENNLNSAYTSEYLVNLITQQTRLADVKIVQYVSVFLKLVGLRILFEIIEPQRAFT